MPDKETGERVRDEMFAADPNCGQCGKPIASVGEATAVYSTGRRAWKLCHKGCVAEAIFAMAPGFSLGGKSARTMPKQVRLRCSVCLTMEENAPSSCIALRPVARNPFGVVPPTYLPHTWVPVE